MKKGPKGRITVPPLDVSALPAERAARVAAFAERFLVVPRGHGAREPFRLRPWQVDILRTMLAPGVRQGLVSLPRGNGKSALAAVLALYGLFADGVEGAQVLTVASDERQARIILDVARRMVELSPELEARTHVYKDHLRVPHTGSTMAALPAEPAALQGWDPSLAIVDELHVVREDTYEAMLLASGKRPTSLLLAISTPGADRDGVMWRLVEAGRAGADPSLGYVEYAAPDGCRLDDRAAWQQANPALGDFLAEDAVAASLRTSRPESFRRYRLGQWAGQAGTWLPWGRWEALRDPLRVLREGERVVLGFDGSASGDSTALVACTLDGFAAVLGAWEKDGRRGWTVPRAEVDRAVDEAFARYDVVELACDPWGWRSEIEAWAARHGESRVLQFPTSTLTRMAPACDRFYQAVLADAVHHDGSERLARHMRNAVAKETAHGAVIVKDKRESPRKIDLAVAAIIAYERASWHAARPARRRVVVF